jgi:hypothetical protein
LKGELKDLGIVSYKRDERGNIDIYQNIELHNQGLTEMPIKFRNVYGHVFMDKNPLRTLKNFPDYVLGDVEVYECDLISLEGAPRKIDGMFECYRNKLTSLMGGPEIVSDEYICYDNNLTSLEGAPIRVERFDCSYNPLKSLMHSPHFVCDNFRARYCELEDVCGVGFIGGYLDITKNPYIEIDCFVRALVRGKIFIGDDMVVDYD